MTGPSSAPRPEHSPRPGVTWETRLVRTEVVVDDPDDTTVHGMNEPVLPSLNRETRRELARKARRKK